MTLWLADLLGIREVVDGSAGNAVLPMRRRIRFIGGAIVADDPGNDATTIEIPLGGEGGGDLPDIATDRLLGRDTAGTGAPEQIIVTNGLGFTGSGGIGIAADGVTDTRLRDSAGLSVIGRGANTTGDPADLVASGDGQVLRRNGTTLAFGTVATLGITDAAVTNAKLANMTGPSFKGRQSGTGAPEDMTATQATALLDVFTSSVKGLVPASGGGTALYLRADGNWDAPPGSGGVVDNGVTFPKIQDIPTDTLIGRDTAGTGDPESITVGGNIEFTGSQSLRRGALTGDVTAAAGSGATTIATSAVTTTKIADANVTDAKLRNSAAVSVIGRSAGTSGVPADIVATGNGQVLRQAGGVLAFGTIDGTSLTNDSITMALLADLAGLSVIGRSANTTGDPAAITAGSDGGVLRRNGTTLAFGTVATSGITDAAVTYAKIQNVTTDRLLGRDTAGSGPPEELLVGGNLEFTGTGIQRGALTGDVTASAGSGATTIATNAVTDAKLRDSVACSVIGRATNTSGDPADIASTVDGQVLQRTAGVLGWGTIATTGLTDGAVTFPKIQQISTDKLLGRDTALTGAVEEIGVGGGLEFTGTLALQRSALTGDVTASAGSGSTTISNNAVSNAKLRDSSACSVIGRSANSVGDPADIASTADGEVFRRTAGVLGWGQIVTAGIADGAVTYAKLQATAAASRVLGRGSASAGAVEELVPSGGVEVSGTALQRSALTGDVTASAGSNATTIANNAVSNAKLRDSAACSLIGRSPNSSGDPADITAAVNDTVCCRTGDAVTFTTISTAMITAAAVTYAKIQNVTPNRILGRDTETAGGIEELTVGGNLEFTTTGGVQRGALTGAVTAPAGSGVTTLAADIVGNTNLRNSVGVSVIGRSANSTGDPADIAASADGQVLVRASGALSFSTVATAGITDAAVTNAKLRNSSALSLIGRPSNTAGVPSDIVSVSDDTALLRQSGALAFGKVPLAAVENIAATTLVGRAVGAGTGAPVALTAAQYRTLHRAAFPRAAYSPAAGAYTSGQILNLNTIFADSNYSLSGAPEAIVVIAETGWYEFRAQAVVRFTGTLPDQVSWKMEPVLSSTVIERAWSWHDHTEVSGGFRTMVHVFGAFQVTVANSELYLVITTFPSAGSGNYTLEYSTGLYIDRIG